VYIFLKEKLLNRTIKYIIFVLENNIWLIYLVCYNLCIRENRVFQINNVLVGLFQKEAKSLKIEALKGKNQNTKLASEGTLSSQTVYNEDMENNENSDQNRINLFIIFLTFRSISRML